MALVESENDLIALCRELGAAQVGGPLSAAEKRLLSRGAGARVAADVVNKAADSLRQGDDPLGESFVEIRSAEKRRGDGAFYTPDRIVRAMVAHVLDERPDRIVDGGCGSGRFLTAAWARGFRGALIGVDLDPVATLMTRAALAAIGAANARIVNNDFLTCRLPRIDGRTAYVGNPPYVRHHGLSRSAKEWAKRAGAKLHTAVSGLAGLHVLFFMAAALRSRPGDVGCFVTSAEWLDTKYGAALRNLLGRRFAVRRMDLVDPRSIAFDDAMSTAVIVSWEDGYDGPLRVRNVRDISELTALGGGRTVGRARLRTTQRWSDLFSKPMKIPTDHVRLGSLARVHRGVVTGSNDFFVMTWDEAADLGISEFVRPCVTRAEEVFSAQGVIGSGDIHRYLLDVPRDVETTPELREYLARGEALGVSEGYICSHRAPWWRVGGSAAPEIIVTYMARQAPAFAVNADGAQILNVLHGIHLDPDLPGGFASALTAWLNLHRDTLSGGRTYHGGLRKFEPSEVQDLWVPAPERLLIGASEAGSGNDTHTAADRHEGAARGRA